MYPCLPVVRGLILVVALWCFTQPILAGNNDSSGADSREDLDRLPVFSLPDLDGKPVSSRLWENKILVLNFWASWCGSCLKEMPELVALEQAFAPRGIKVIGIAIDEPDPVRRFVKYYGINYLVLVDQEAAYQLAKRLGNHSGGIPFTAIIDATGHVRYIHEGTVDRSTLNAIIIGLL